MKKVRNNLWNRLFHSKALKEYQEWKKEAHSIIGWNRQLNEDLKNEEEIPDSLIAQAETNSGM